MPNKTTRILLAASVAALVSACAPPAPVEFNGHSVVMRTNTPQLLERQEAEQEAQIICSKVGKRAEYASTTYVHDLNYRNLFLCI